LDKIIYIYIICTDPRHWIFARVPALGYHERTYSTKNALATRPFITPTRFAVWLLQSTN